MFFLDLIAKILTLSIPIGGTVFLGNEIQVSAPKNLLTFANKTVTYTCYSDLRLPKISSRRKKSKYLPGLILLNQKFQVLNLNLEGRSQNLASQYASKLVHVNNFYAFEIKISNLAADNSGNYTCLIFAGITRKKILKNFDLEKFEVAKFLNFPKIVAGKSETQLVCLVQETGPKFSYLISADPPFETKILKAKNQTLLKLATCWVENFHPIPDVYWKIFNVENPDSFFQEKEVGAKNSKLISNLYINLEFLSVAKNTEFLA